MHGLQEEQRGLRVIEGDDVGGPICRGRLVLPAGGRKLEASALSMACHGVHAGRAWRLLMARGEG